MDSAIKAIEFTLKLEDVGILTITALFHSVKAKYCDETYAASF